MSRIRMAVALQQLTVLHDASTDTSANSPVDEVIQAFAGAGLEFAICCGIDIGGEGKLGVRKMFL